MGAVAASTFVAFLPALRNGFFVLDDGLYVENNTHIRTLGWPLLRWAFTDTLVYWHPLTWLSLAVDYRLWGLDPFGYHLTNVLLHALNAVLVFFLTLRLGLRRDGGAQESGPSGWAYGGAFFAAASFALHPLRVESVAWVTERKDVLYAFFFLIGITLYLLRDRAEPSRRAWLYGASLSCACLSLMSKPVALAFPLVLLVIDYYLSGRMDLRRALREKLPLLAVAAVGVVLLTLKWWTVGGSELSWADRLDTALRAPALYLAGWLLPFQTAPIHPFVPLSRPTLGTPFWISVAALLGVTGACVAVARKERLFAAAWLYYLVMLLPSLHTVGDRFSYLASPGLSWMALLAADRVSNRPQAWIRPLLAAVGGVWLCFLSVRTLELQRVWGDRTAFWSRQVAAFPEVAAAHVELGAAYGESGYVLEALREFKEAERLNSASLRQSR